MNKETIVKDMLLYVHKERCQLAAAVVGRGGREESEEEGDEGNEGFSLFLFLKTKKYSPALGQFHE
jgi:hypothetical protein